MERTLGRTCLILALLGVLLAVTLSVNPGARADGAPVAAQAGTMQLQGNAEADAGPEDAEKRMERCELGDPSRPLKQELAFLLAAIRAIDGRQEFHGVVRRYRQQIEGLTGSPRTHRGTGRIANPGALDPGHTASNQKGPPCRESPSIVVPSGENY